MSKNYIFPFSNVPKPCEVSWDESIFPSLNLKNYMVDQLNKNVSKISVFEKVFKSANEGKRLNFPDSIIYEEKDGDIRKIKFSCTVRTSQFSHYVEYYNIKLDGKNAKYIFSMHEDCETERSFTTIPTFHIDSYGNFIKATQGLKDSPFIHKYKRIKEVHSLYMERKCHEENFTHFKDNLKTYQNKLSNEEKKNLEMPIISISKLAEKKAANCYLDYLVKISKKILEYDEWKKSLSLLKTQISSAELIMRDFEIKINQINQKLDDMDISINEIPFTIPSFFEFCLSSLPVKERIFMILSFIRVHSLDSM